QRLGSAIELVDRGGRETDEQGPLRCCLLGHIVKISQNILASNQASYNHHQMSAEDPAPGRAAGSTAGSAGGRAAAETAIAAQRLAAQQIAGSAFKRPAELVAWMGAIQAQEPLAAQWALGLRLGAPGGAKA